MPRPASATSVVIAIQAEEDVEPVEGEIAVLSSRRESRAS
jgi:hypothetical protein